MPDSQLNGAERALQHSFSKSQKIGHIFNGLIVGLASLLAFAAMDRLPDHYVMPPAEVPLNFQRVRLEPAGGPLRLAGAWALNTVDPRFGGISALMLDGGRFLAVTDRGAVARFDQPAAMGAKAWLADLRDGPGPFERKWARDAESLVHDPSGRGWWVGYEQRHSLWLYDLRFGRALTSIDLRESYWPDNRGAEGLTVVDGKLLVLAENGKDAVLIEHGKPRLLTLHAGIDVAEAARTPDGGTWLLLREKGLSGIKQSIAPLFEAHDGYRIGPRLPVPKAALDNYEGMAIEARAYGWRFWLISDDGHRVMARTLLVALDLDAPGRHDKSPAPGAGPSKKPSDSAL